MFIHMVGRIFCVLCILSLFPLPGVIKAKSGKTDLTVLEHVHIDTLLDHARQEPNGQRAVELSEKAYRDAMASGSLLYIAKSALQSGIAWKSFGEPSKSLERLTLAMQSFRTLQMEYQEHLVHLALGETYRAAFQHSLAIDHLQKAKVYFQMKNDGVYLAKTYDRLAATLFEVIYKHPFYHHLDTISHQDHALFMREAEHHPELFALIQQMSNCLDSAIMLAARNSIPETRYAALILKASLANALHDVGNSILQHQELIREMESAGITRDLPLVMINLARIQGKYRLNQPEVAIALAQKALTMAKTYNIPVYQYLATEVLHDNYLAIGDYKTAYDLLRELRGLHEALEFDKMKMVVANRDYELSIRELDYELRQRTIAQHTAIAVGVIVIMMVGSVLFVYFRANRKLKKVLADLQEESALITVQNLEMTKVNMQKDRLISIIAHDLRNPFNSILGFSELIQEEMHSYEPADIRRYAGMIRTSAQQTLQLLTSLLEWSRFQEGRVEFNPDRQSLRSIVLEALQILLFQSNQKNIRIHLQISANLMVMADRTMIVTVLRNLVSNAIKFTHPKGEIWLDAHESEGLIHVQVRDSGVGMSAEKVDKLFRIDTWITTPGTRDEMGSGFGLILTKEFVEKHNGRVWAESAEGTGSTFTFTLPKA